MPPNICRELAQLRLLLGHESWRHVWLTIYFFGVEVVGLWVLDVYQDVVVLCRPARLGSCPIVICPDDLV